ncbi:MEDS domain-containing protein [Pseudonocardia halophobica]|uniref:MEDS domain-containing protein n=1 Tax=Pseudonocardia halophobica TaxID=29401 RepID=UPI003D8C388D
MHGTPITIGDRRTMTADTGRGPTPATHWLEGPHSALVHRSRRTEDERVGAWMARELSRGRQLVYKYAESDPAVRHRLTALLGGDVLASGRVRLVEAARCHAETAGEPAALRGWHLELIEQARDAGHPGVAIVCDGTALRTITPDPVAMLAHELDLTRLAAANPLTVLCHYDTSTETPTALQQVVGTHTALDDIRFAARRDPEALTISGEIDISNADRFGAVLRAAIDHGTRTVEISEVRHLAAAGCHVVLDALPRLRAAGQTLVLLRPGDAVRQILDIAGLGETENLVISA